MKNKNLKCDDKIIGALTQVVLNDALNSVLTEFERNTDTRIGKIIIGSKIKDTDKREINIEVKKVGDKCLKGLSKYKDVLCRDKKLKDEAFCHTGSF